ncbi:exonuclease domain-containing protein [Brevundimonas sp.]|uniref:exonuclease domain-containing protein n=1 Tax=Brevundimonas sp. TaxID=1871086 RepID=UPI003F6E7881
MGFVIYDTETTGLNKGFDQIVQFAAIHTDAELNELDRFELRCRLQPHVVPHPKALSANRLSIERLTDPTLPTHYEMVREIRWRLSQWGKAIFIGYNSIRFDEEMLRHAFFQSLFPAYLTSSPGCGRADAMHVALAACAESAPCLTLPLDEDGRTTFRLEAVAAANGFSLGPAHDAASDAATTLALCRRVAAAAPEVWSRFIRAANKAAVADLVASEPVFVLSEFFGFQASHRLVSFLAPEGQANPNGRLCWDLAADPAQAAALADAELAALAAPSDGPVRRLRVNAAPAITMSWDAPAEWGFGDIGEAEERAAWLKSNPGFGARVAAAHAMRWANRPPSSHVEQQLYDHFPSDHDQALMADFHEASKEGRRAIINQLADPRLRTFAWRLLHAQHRSAFTDADRRAADTDLAKRLLEDCEGPLTLPRAQTLIHDLLIAGEADTNDLLKGYSAWLEVRMEKAKAFLAQA